MGARPPALVCLKFERRRCAVEGAGHGPVGWFCLEVGFIWRLEVVDYDHAGDLPGDEG